MRYRAVHVTRFRYSAPVFLEPHTIRLRPRSNSWQRLERFSLEVKPTPTQVADGIDSEGNDVVHAWFAGTTECLAVRSEFEVETLRPNPFDYLLVRQRDLQLPVEYPARLRPQLDPAVRRVRPLQESVADFSGAIAGESEGKTQEFLAKLAAKICDTHEVAVRREGDPQHPSETLKTRRGACRDLAVLFMDCCRVQGVAARFVSGYQEPAPGQAEQFMHAWAEVYRPGGGWRGYDPSQGLAVSDRHIAVAAAADPRLAAPVVGTFRGEAAMHPLEVSLRVSQA